MKTHLNLFLAHSNPVQPILIHLMTVKPIFNAAQPSEAHFNPFQPTGIHSNPVQPFLNPFQPVFFLFLFYPFSVDNEVIESVLVPLVVLVVG